MKTGPLNLITDLAGLRVGNVTDVKVGTGVTVIVFDCETVASGVIRGGAPGSRDTALLEPEMTIQSIDAVVLSGGSVFGLDAAGGVISALSKQGRGFAVGAVRVPIAVQAIAFDLLNGGDKAWGRMPPYWDMGYAAAERARSGPFALGSVGGGYGATTATLKGGLGSASLVTPSGFTVAAIAIVNAIGTATIGDGPHFWAAPYEIAREYGGLGLPAAFSRTDLVLRTKGLPQEPATTLVLVATNARLTKPEAKRLAHMADDGLSRAIRPAHAAMDGDTVFVVSTLERPVTDRHHFNEIGLAAGDVVARAIARGVYEATALPFPGALPAWRNRFAPHAATPSADTKPQPKPKPKPKP